jgi:hypothetical protein
MIELIKIVLIVSTKSTNYSIGDHYCVIVHILHLSVDNSLLDTLQAQRLGCVVIVVVTYIIPQSFAY